MEYDIHTLLDLATLGTTLWVIYMIRFKLRSSYMEDKDNLAIYYVILFLCYPNCGSCKIRRLLNHSRLIMYLLWVLQGFGHSWPSAYCSVIWTVAFYGSYLRNCSNIHISRLLSLLREKRYWRTTCIAPSFRSSLMEDASFEKLIMAVHFL